jgi:ribonucleotide reductase alpha subunit
VLSSLRLHVSTPTLFNSGTPRSQLSSCYLTTVPDDLDGIYEAIKENALLSKYAGGLGNDWTRVRALGSHIKGTNGKSQGVVPFLKVVNDTAVAVNQGGKRKGAVCAYLETWHLDIEEFLELRKNTGDDRRRTHDMNTANWIPDLFMKRVMEGGPWTLFSPSDVPDLHDKFGAAFEEAYWPTRQGRERGEIKPFKTHAGHRPVAQDAVDAVRDRPPLDHLQGRLQRALARSSTRRGALVQPVHRDHAQHQRHRNRGVQPGLHQPGAAHEGRQGIDHAKLQAHGGARRCACSTT